jgi:hypothetical protein
MKKILISLFISSRLFAGGGHNEGKQNKLSDVPVGYKLVKQEADCVEPDPCAEEKKLIEKLKKEIDFLKARNKLIEAQNDILQDTKKDCPIVEPKIKYIDKFVDRPFEKVVTKEVVRVVPADRSIAIGGMVAYSQDGIETEESKAPDAVDATTYESIIGGPYITIPLGNTFEIGAFGMFGGVNKTFGLKAGISLK